MLGNPRKYSERRGPACALRCTPVNPCVPLCTPRKYSKMLDNTPQSGGKYSDILGNARKYSEILGKTRKCSEILGNTRKQGVLPVRFVAQACVPLCIPVYPPEILGNARQYPSIRREILSNTWKGSEILGNTPQQTKRAKSRVPNIWLESVVLLYRYTLFLRLK